MYGNGLGTSDPRRPDKQHRYKPPPPTAQASPGEDLTPDYMNILGMIFSMCGLMMRVSIFEYVAAIYVFKCITVMIDNCH